MKNIEKDIMINKRGQGEKELKYIELEAEYNNKEEEINYRNTVFKKKIN